MTPLLAIAGLRVRRYVRRELGGGVTRMDMTDEAVLEPPLNDNLFAELEAFRVPPPKHRNVPRTAFTA